MDRYGKFGLPRLIMKSGSDLHKSNGISHSRFDTGFHSMGFMNDTKS